MIKGIIFDYGGTLDSRGVHWSEVIWQGYCRFDEQAGAQKLGLTKEQFREAYVHAERALAKERIIQANDDFYRMMLKKVEIELRYAVEQGMTHASDSDTLAMAAEVIARHCDDTSRDCVDEAAPMLERIAGKMPLMLVSNFYGNICAVLEARGIRHLFKGVIESAVVGVRKPNPAIFRLGVDALEIEPQQTLVVGDSLKKDILPAEAIGCKTLWLKGKGWTEEEDNATHPSEIKSILQVEKMLHGL